MTEESTIKIKTKSKKSKIDQIYKTLKISQLLKQKTKEIRQQFDIPKNGFPLRDGKDFLFIAQYRKNLDISYTEQCHQLTLDLEYY